jgi:hypothetical protein
MHWAHDYIHQREWRMLGREYSTNVPRTQKSTETYAETLARPKTLAETLAKAETLAETLTKAETLAETLARPETLAETLAKSETLAETLAKNKTPNSSKARGMSETLVEFSENITRGSKFTSHTTERIKNIRETKG